MRPEAARRSTETRGRGSTTNWLIGALLLLVGVGVGLFLAWNVEGFMLVLTDNDPPDLREEWQEAWVLMTAQSLAITGDEAVARRRLVAYEREELAQLLGQLYQTAPDEQTRQQLLRLAEVAAVPAGATGPATVPPGEAAALEEGASPLRLLLLACGALLIAILLLGAVGILLTRMQVNRRGAAPASPPRRGSRATPVTPASTGATTTGIADLESDPMDEDALDELVLDMGEVDLEEDAFREIDFDEVEEDFPDITARPVTAPAPAAALDQFVARYNLGDKDYDINFVIETPNAEFLGECGVAVSEVLDSGAPQRVTALEVWLFDKDDIRTVTKVLLSSHAAADEAIRSRLQPKGELIEAQQGETLELETASLRVQARLREVAYGWEPEYPEKSYFEHVVIELLPIQKTTSSRRAIEF